MNRSVLLSLISILTVVGLVGGLTYAFFSDQGASNNNVFATGTLNLQLDDVDQTVTENVTASLGSTTLVPNASTSGFISLHNGGSINMAEIKLGANQTANTNGADGSNLADVLDLTVKTGDDTVCAVNPIDHTSDINTALGGGTSLTLAELNGSDYDSLPGLTVGATRYLCITFTMQSTAENGYQGDSITEDFVFEGHQDASQ